MRVPDVETNDGPPLWLPLAHVLVGFCFLLSGLGVGLLVLTGRLGTAARLAAVHLLLLGWVCHTIMGAMEQFVPVWSGVELHSVRLATLALVAVTVGTSGLAGSALLGRPDLFGVGVVAVAGVLLFVYTVGRTLPFGDLTERGFAYALGAFTLAVVLGGLLALDISTGVLARVGLRHAAVRSAHVTLAVLGGVFLTVVAALFQLGPMFAGDGRLDATGRRCARLGEATLPVGVVLLAGGRGLQSAPVARLGGVLVVGGTLAATSVLVWSTWTGRADSSPTATRYAVVAVSLLAWCLSAGPAFVSTPLSTYPLGPPEAVAAFGVALAAVLVGTLYHVVPFLVWDHRYADALGYGPVPMVDDLYSSLLERADLVGLCLGGATLVVSVGVGVEDGVRAGAAIVSAALALAALNLTAVGWTHLVVEEDASVTPSAGTEE